MSEITIKLDSPVMHGDKELTSLTLRKLRTGDIVKTGYPYSTGLGDNDEITVNIKPKTIAKYIVLLGNVPPSVVDKLDFADFNKCQAEIMTFFGKSAAG